MTKDRVEKLHVLAVLEKRKRGENARGVLALLVREFGFKFDKRDRALNSLRKNLNMCWKQGLVQRDKLLGRCYHYWISEKGRRRLSVIRARREREFERRLEQLFKSRDSERLRRAQEKRKREWLVERMVEVEASLRLCDTVLSGSIDKNTVDLARHARLLLQRKKLELIPYVAEEQVKIIEQLAGSYAKLIEYLSQKIANIMQKV